MYEGIDPLGGVLCMSGLLPLKNIPSISTSNAHKETQMHIYTGDIDTKVYYEDIKYTTDKVLKTIYTGEYAQNYKF